MILNDSRHRIYGYKHRRQPKRNKRTRERINESRPVIPERRNADITARPLYPGSIQIRTSAAIAASNKFLYLILKQLFRSGGYLLKHAMNSTVYAA
jgi:hypothetical protein